MHGVLEHWANILKIKRFQSQSRFLASFGKSEVWPHCICLLQTKPGLAGGDKDGHIDWCSTWPVTFLPDPYVGAWSSHILSPHLSPHTHTHTQLMMCRLKVTSWRERLEDLRGGQISLGWASIKMRVGREASSIPGLIWATWSWPFSRSEAIHLPLLFKISTSALEFPLLHGLC